MSKRGWWNASLLLILAGIVCVVVSRRSAQEASHARPGFSTRDEALQSVIARLLAAERLDTAGDPYTSTFTREYETVAGVKTQYFLVADAARELELAQGFEAQGFDREALAHYENLISYHGASPQAAIARERREGCRKKTVLGLVAPMSIVFRDPEGRHFVPVGAACPAKPNLDRIEEPYLERFTGLKGPFTAVGFIDDAGTIVRTRDERPDPTAPSDSLPG